MYLIREKKNVWILLSGLAIAVLLLVYMPLLAQVRKKDQELGGLIRQLSASGLELSGLSGDAGGKKIVGEAEASALVDRITREAKACLLDIKSASQKEIRAVEDGYLLLPLHLEAEARFEQLGVFLGSLDGLDDGLVGVDSFKILGEERLGPKVSAFLSLNLYLQKDINE